MRSWRRVTTDSESYQWRVTGQHHGARALRTHLRSLIINVHIHEHFIRAREQQVLVKQAANVLDLLEFFANRLEPASLSEIAQHFGWPRSSTFNLVSTLVERSFLYEPKPRGGYYPTPRWLSLAHDITAAEPLPEPLLRLLKDLADQTGETVYIAAASGQHAVFLEVIPSRHPVGYMAYPGKRIPLYATA